MNHSNHGRQLLSAAAVVLGNAGYSLTVALFLEPAGLVAGDGEPDVFPMEVQAGDCIVMVSDGITAGREDGWLRQALEQFDGLSPQELARKILADSREQVGGGDDRTVIALKVDVRQ